MIGFYSIFQVNSILWLWIILKKKKENKKEKYLKKNEAFLEDGGKSKMHFKMKEKKERMFNMKK